MFFVFLSLPIYYHFRPVGSSRFGSRACRLCVWSFYTWATTSTSSTVNPNFPESSMNAHTYPAFLNPKLIPDLHKSSLWKCPSVWWLGIDKQLAFHFLHLVNFIGWLETVGPEWLRNAEELTPKGQIDTLSSFLYTGQSEILSISLFIYLFHWGYI